MVDVDELVNFLKSRKNREQSMSLFLGHRVGILSTKLYEVLKERLAVPEHFAELLNQNTSTAQELSRMRQYLELLVKSQAAERSEPCYDFLEKNLSEEGIDKLLLTALAFAQPRAEDKLIAGLIKTNLFDTVLTTNFDTLLEKACTILRMENHSDYEVFICRKDDSTMINHRSSRLVRIIKVFGDLSSGNYKTVQNELSLEKRENEELKDFLMSELSKDIVVLGYDPAWDRPIERAFQQKGGMLWYVNEKQPVQDTHLDFIFKQRYGKYIGEYGQNYLAFLQRLSSSLVEEQPIRDIVPPVVPPLVFPNNPLRNKVFISYSHKDTDFLKRCRVHLKGLDPIVLRDNVWDDTKIQIGDDWEKEIRTTLERTKVAILLISADFYASEFIQNKELPVLLEAARAGQVTIVSVLLKASKFGRDENLRRYQAINSAPKWLAALEVWEQEVIWDELAEKISKIL